MITIMTIIREKEIIATKETSLIFGNETAWTSRQSRFKNQARSISFIFKVFLVATFNAFPFLLLSL